MLLLARMYMAGEIYFVMNGATVEQSRLYEALTKVRNWRKIIIKQRKKISNELLETIRKLGQDLFGQTGPENQEKLFNFFTENLTQWKNRLAQYQTLAQTGNYPGLEEIQEGINLINVLLDEKESYSFFQRVNDRKDELLDFVETFQDIDTFYTSQRKVWDRLRSEYEKFKLNS
jgi:hypothetical protein